MYLGFRQQKFKLNEFVGKKLIGARLVYPSLTAISRGTLFKVMEGTILVMIFT